ncbi:MAG: NADH-quinone oxidoreductase subunit NuoH [Planctomycetes bacterium]|nr:NADH-quinone oxidoreductase subunit NuoH [Planctomycetota bacterium]
MEDFLRQNIVLVSTLAKAIVVPIAIMNVVPFMVLLERRGSAFIQDRRGPERASIFGIRMFGLWHTIADAMKFITKEKVVPAGAHPVFFYMAPALLLIPAIGAFAGVPFAADVTIAGETIPLQVARLDAGILYAFGVASLGVLGIALAGWASNNKFSLLGSLRSASQMLSYEVSMGLTIMGVLLIYQSLRPEVIVQAQAGPIWKWGIFVQPVGAVLFLVVGFAEANRLPFDLPEGDSELVAGYHTEYSGMKFAIFFMSEYMSMVTISAMVTTLFLGGWQIPFVTTERLHGWFGTDVAGQALTALCQVTSFAAKVGSLLWLFVWVRWTQARFRFDQLMKLGWRTMLPLALLNLIVTAAVMLVIWKDDPRFGLGFTG